MAKSKYEYVKDYETSGVCLPGCWIVVRIDGRGFTNFAEKHNFEKPNDMRAIGLMNAAAKGVMEEFPDIVLAYGQSDEYSFVIKKSSTIFNRRTNKIVSVICSAFTALYVMNWPKFFGTEPILSPPHFDSRVVLYPSDHTLKDYMSWRQADAHINNLYNTCFWNLVQKKKLTPQEAEEYLKGTVSSDKNELLFSEFGINYNNEPKEFRKGTIIIKSINKKLDILNTDIIGNSFWESHKYLLKPSKSSEVVVEEKPERKGKISKRPKELREQKLCEDYFKPDGTFKSKATKKVSLELKEAYFSADELI